MLDMCLVNSEQIPALSTPRRLATRAHIEAEIVNEGGYIINASP